jgi:hypothetical protein
MRLSAAHGRPVRLAVPSHADQRRYRIRSGSASGRVDLGGDHNTIGWMVYVIHNNIDHARTGSLLD